jgi:hypothetical protein
MWGGGTLLDSLPNLLPLASSSSSSSSSIATTSIINQRGLLEVGVVVVILCDPSLSVAECRQVYIKTGLHPLSFLWLLDSVSHYCLLPSHSYQLQIFDTDTNNIHIETQNSLAL